MSGWTKNDFINTWSEFSNTPILNGADVAYQYNGMLCHKNEKAELPGWMLGRIEVPHEKGDDRIRPMNLDLGTDKIGG
jgi:hypothetical protein